MRKLKVVSIVLTCLMALVLVSCQDVINFVDNGNSNDWTDGGGHGGGSGEQGNEGPQGPQGEEGPWVPQPTPQQVWITVTDIPSRYHGNLGDLLLLMPGISQSSVANEVQFVTSSSVTFHFWVVPGTYDIVLWLNNFAVEYALLNRTVNAGSNFISWYHFSNWWW